MNWFEVYFLIGVIVWLLVHFIMNVAWPLTVKWFPEWTEESFTVEDRLMMDWARGDYNLNPLWTFIKMTVFWPAYARSFFR